MKRIIYILGIVLIPFFVYSQTMRLGFTANEIQAEFKGSSSWSWEYTSSYGGYHILVADNYKWTTLYYFKTKSSPCNLSMQYPKDIGTLNFLIKEFNRDYTLVERNYWMVTGFGGEKLYVILEYTDNGEPYFMYGYLDETL